MGERETSGLDFGVTGGQDLPKQRVQIEEDIKREFRIAERLLSKCGFTMGCNGCEGKLTGNGVQPHTHECRARLEEVMRAAVRVADVLHRRDSRMHERQHAQGRITCSRKQNRSNDSITDTEPTKRSA